MLIAALLLVLACGYRVVAALTPDLANFSPLMAIAFCGAVYLGRRKLWLVPFAALLLSDLFLDRYYAAQFGYHWDASGMVVRTLAFAAAVAIGFAVARRKSWLNLASGILGASVLFYLATNTVSWAGDVAYAKSAAGWWQAMTIGHPEFPPTLFFFRNSLVSDLLFTGAFALAMEWAALRRAQPTLLRTADVT
ncbi:hypothetical protein K0B96_04195 [Horticoccus luteus]|uniref:Uncharacterized protein n=1 Tax=Horticoccus luteus TaxID=2862869 RepID=A0A8F9TX14_9BACT|nr:DUF6580 family putative transport protein [Horticoccus luteus]QYM79828.1 hypothetical protein K0B96_04195 [Horticoccus luteus]